MAQAARRAFSCLGHGERATGRFREPDRFRDLLIATSEGRQCIQGSGLSLAGAGFSEGALVTGMRRFDRIMAFDADEGSLTVEAGATLGQLYRFLAPQGFQIAVQPGHPAITIGGCIAANVHGKNQSREGLFADHVVEIGLFHPDHGELVLSRSSHPEIFELTCGGFGLTGMITSAKLRLLKLMGHHAHVARIPVASLTAAADFVTTRKADYDFCFTWHDLAQFGKGFGRGFVSAGKILPGGAPSPGTWQALDCTRDFRAPLFNRLTMPLINAAYLRLNGQGETALPLYEAMFPFAARASYFYAFGRRGFIEHQTLVPLAKIPEYLAAFEKILRRRKIPCSLASLKAFSGIPNLLHFTGEGISLAIHIWDEPESRAMLAEIDEIDVSYGARANIIKDARLPAAMMRAQYPQAAEFSARLAAFDPHRRFRSALTERLEL